MADAAQVRERPQDNDHRLPGRVLRALDQTDKMPRELRGCVHEYGSAIVQACLSAGVSDPRRIRQLVNEIWEGARQPQQRRNLHHPDTHSPVLDKLDWLLIQAGSGISAATLLRVLWQNGMVILPSDPGSVMIEASMATVNKFNERMTKQEKHRRRLKEAINAQARRLWPHLFTK